MIKTTFNGALISLRKKIGIQQLEKREKIFLSIGVIFLLCFCLIQFVFFPYFDARKRLTRSIASKREDLAKIMQMQQKYRLLKHQAGTTKDKLSERAPGFTLFSFLEEQATKADVKQQIQYMKPSTSEKEGEEQQSIVEMKLQHISLAQLVDFLKLVESPKDMVFVKRISIQESGSEGKALDIIVQVFTFVNKE